MTDGWSVQAHWTEDRSDGSPGHERTWPEQVAGPLYRYTAQRDAEAMARQLRWAHPQAEVILTGPSHPTGRQWTIDDAAKALARDGLARAREALHPAQPPSVAYARSEYQTQDPDTVASASPGRST